MKILYCGFGRAGLECLYQLIISYNLSNRQIVVFTHDAQDNEEFLKHLVINRIEFYYENINQCYGLIEKFKPDYLISVYYRYIIKSDILKIVNYKAMNLHPALLPSYKGTKSSVWALINHEHETGISFHYITEKIDSGRILFQEKIKIQDEDTAYSLYHKLVSLFVKYFAEVFQRLIDGFQGYEQIGQESYYKRELPFGGVRNFSEISYDDAKQFVKAMYFPPFKGAMFRKDNGEEIEVLSTLELDTHSHLFRK